MKRDNESGITKETTIDNKGSGERKNRRRRSMETQNTGIREERRTKEEAWKHKRRIENYRRDDN